MRALNFKLDSRIDQPTRERLRDFCSNLGEDIVALANDLGVKIFAKDLWPYESGYLEHAPSCGSQSGYRIVVNERHTVERQRFTVAHELAHFLLHREDVPKGDLEDRRHRSEDGFVYVNRGDEAQEREANKFAATLLMPQNLFVPAFDRLDGRPDQLAKLFLVSESAANRRIAELRLTKK